MGKRRRHGAAFKAKVALGSSKGGKDTVRACGAVGSDTNQIGQCRKKLLKELPALFSEKGKQREKDR